MLGFAPLQPLHFLDSGYSVGVTPKLLQAKQQHAAITDVMTPRVGRAVLLGWRGLST
jgi:hypothetical protein